MSSLRIPVADVRSGVWVCNEVAQDNSVPLSDVTFRTFAHLCDDAPLVLPLNEYDVRLILEDSLVADRRGIDVHPAKIEDWSVLPAIQAFLSAHPEGVFAKIADASPKDGGVDLYAQRHTMQPLHTLEALWRALATSRRVQTFLCFTAGPCDLVLRPWNAAITPDTEWRVFVRDRRCVAISQQHLYRSMAMFDEATVTRAITTWVGAHTLAQPSAVLDMFVDDAGVAYLIECNPWSMRSGSALFRWDELRAAEPVLFRAVCD